MSASQQQDKMQYLQPETQAAIAAFSELGVDDQLALLYLIYQEMGKSITPAAPTATDPNLAPLLLGNFYELAESDQLEIMRQIVRREDTEYSRAYGALKENNQLMVWYAWAQAMGETVIGMPQNYQANQGIQSVLSQLKNLGFEHQISVLREVASRMGYTNVQSIPTQSETGKTPSL